MPLKQANQIKLIHLHKEKFHFGSRKVARCYLHHHHHHVVPPARISLTLSTQTSLSFIASGRSSGLHPVSSQSYFMYVRAGRPAFVRLYVRLHRSSSLMSSSLLLQQCPASLARLTWIVFVMEVSGRIVGALWGVASMTFQYCSQHSCAIAVYHFLQPFS